MYKKDILKKYLAHNGQVRVFLLDATKMVREFRDLHFASNVVTAAVGRTLMASAMMASMLKNKEDRINIKGIVVCGSNSLEMKAYAKNPKVDIPLKKNGKLDVSGIVGSGYLNVVKDIGLKEPYNGVCKLVSSEIAEDFAYYFATSEQTPTAVFLGVNFSKENTVQKAAGYIIEPLPDASDSVITMLEQINSNISSVTNLVIDLKNLDDVAKTITGDNDIICIEEKEPVLKCDCNKERIENTIIALGKEEVEKILKENNDILELSCQFCNKVYRYTKEDVEKIFK